MAPSGADPAANKALVERLTRELFNDGGDLDVVEELLAEDFVDHMPAQGSAGDRASYRERAAAMRGPFTEIRTTSEQLVAEGDQVAERWTSRFRHTGEFMGMAATGREVHIDGFALYRLRDGRVTEFWGLSDALALMEQLGG